MASPPTREASSASATITKDPPFDPSTLTRPDPSLLRYYAIVAAFTTVAFPFVFFPLFFRYRTLRYAFDVEGISLSWGILFHKEIHLTYRRIQDIHLTRNVVQRWMGLSTVEIQTASGSASAEMKIEGILEAEPLRDYLYSKMRGMQEEEEGAAGGNRLADEGLKLLKEIREELAAINRDLEGRKHHG